MKILPNQELTNITCILFDLLESETFFPIYFCRIARILMISRTPFPCIHVRRLNHYDYNPIGNQESWSTVHEACARIDSC